MEDGCVLLHVQPSHRQVLEKKEQSRIVKAEVVSTDIAFPCLAAGHLKGGSWDDPGVALGVQVVCLSVWSESKGAGIKMSAT